jgi:hypothetical protein
MLVGGGRRGGPIGVRDGIRARAIVCARRIRLNGRGGSGVSGCTSHPVHVIRLAAGGLSRYGPLRVLGSSQSFNEPHSEGHSAGRSNSTSLRCLRPSSAIDQARDWCSKRPTLNDGVQSPARPGLSLATRRSWRSLHRCSQRMVVEQDRANSPRHGTL